jgi:protoheme IX farnesyltransferase
MPFVDSMKNYWELTKPKIWFLLVFTGVAAMLVAYREVHRVPSLIELLLGMSALTFGSAAADTLTNYHDRDIDSVMKRTSGRPIPSGRISPKRALVFGLSLAVLSIILALSFNWLAATFMAVGLVDNIVVYSLWLKRRSWLNIILGGISGGMPVLVGYSAIAGTVSPLALFMSALVIVWIPTHIWSLAMRCRVDYENAKIPMLPVIVSERVATACIAFTSSLLAVFSVAIFAFTAVSPFYVVAALVSGAAILGYSIKLAIDQTVNTAWKLFKLSSPYLAIIFTVLVIDVWFFPV